MDIKKILELHKLWLNNEEGGVKANIRHANLEGANLWDAPNIMLFGPMPTSGRIIYAVRHDSGWKVQASCFWGDLNELERRVKANHNCPMYLGIIELLRKI